MFRKTILYVFALITLATSMDAAGPQDFTVWGSTASLRGKNSLTDPPAVIRFPTAKGFDGGAGHSGPQSRRIFLVAQARYLPLEVDSRSQDRDTTKINLNPLIGSVGF